MSEPSFREIQLNTKQVVFLFMACVVAAVAIFLLGVSVGRGVNAGTAATPVVATPESASEVGSAGTALPSTPPKSEDLTYHTELQGKPAVTPAAPPEPKPAVPKPAAPTAAATPAAKPAPTKTAPAASASLFVQVDSFGSKANADRRVSELKARGYSSAFVFTAPGTGARFKVRVGPFADRAAADAMQAKLRQEGFKPSVTR